MILIFDLNIRELVAVPGIDHELEALFGTSGFVGAECSAKAPSKAPSSESEKKGGAFKCSK